MPKCQLQTWLPYYLNATRQPCSNSAEPKTHTEKTKETKKGNHLHLLRKANIYFKLQYRLFNHKKKEKNSDLTVVTSCAKNVRYKNGNTR